MTTWNYRVVAVDEQFGTSWAIYEVYYGMDGRPEARTMGPAQFVSDEGVDELASELAFALRAINAPVLDDAIFSHGGVREESWRRSGWLSPEVHESIVATTRARAVHGTAREILDMLADDESVNEETLARLTAAIRSRYDIA